MSLQVRSDRSSILRMVRERREISDEESQRLCTEEARWHFSQHYFAELRGEEVIEDILMLSPSRRARAILESQMADEISHAKIYSKIANKLGVIGESRVFATQYSEIVLGLPTLPEKIFVFQVLTESVAHAYITWRISAIADESINNIDRRVLSDEVRHLDMASALLRICSPDEIASCLPLARRRALVREVLTVAQTGFHKAVSHCSSLIGVKLEPSQSEITEVDALVAKTVLAEAKRQISAIAAGC